MDLPISELTYHSRRRDYENSTPYTPQNLPLKYTQAQQQPRPTIASQFTPFPPSTMPKDPTLINPTNLNSQTSSYPQVSPIMYLQTTPQEKPDQQHKNSSELQQQRQKVRTLSQHLKSALQSNNQQQQRYNILRTKIEQKEIKFMNETSVLKAELIILKKEFEEMGEEGKRKDGVIGELKRVVEGLREEGRAMKEKFESGVRENQVLRRELVEKGRYENEIQSLKQSLTRTTQQLTKLTTELATQHHTLTQYQQTTTHQTSHIISLQAQLSSVQKSFESLLAQHSSCQSTTQFQKNRIDQLNEHIKEICQNTDHLFEEIRELQVQKQVLDERIDQKEREKVEVEKRLEEVLENLSQCEMRCEELQMRSDITQEQYRQLADKYASLQQENIQLSRNNTQLVRQVDLLDQEVKELKEICIRQQGKENQLMNIMKNMEGHLIQARMDKDQEDAKKVREEVRRGEGSVRPTRDGDRRIKTESWGEGGVERKDGVGSSGVERNNVLMSRLPNQAINNNNYNNNNGPRFNYLSDLQTHPIPPAPYHPYTQFLSFQPSRPTYPPTHPLLSTQENPKRRAHTSHGSPPSPSTYKQKPSINYYAPDYRSLNQHQNDRKSKSFYVQRKSEVMDQTYDVYRSVVNPINRQQNNNNSLMRAMRRSLDLREKSLDLQNSLMKINKKDYPIMEKSKRHERMHTQAPQATNQLLDNPSTYQPRDIFLTKLQKLKLWPKQQPTTSQHPTQRSALHQLPTNSDYYKPSSSQIPIQAIIKQKSSILHQRKNLLAFNLNNQMIQRNILKLQKGTGGQGMMDSGRRVKGKGVEGLSTIRERREEGGGSGIGIGIGGQVLEGCRKVLYKG